MQELILLMPFPGARAQMLLQEINTFTHSILNHTFATWPGMEQRSISVSLPTPTDSFYTHFSHYESSLSLVSSNI